MLEDMVFTLSKFNENQILLSLFDPISSFHGIRMAKDIYTVCFQYNDKYNDRLVLSLTEPTTLIFVFTFIFQRK